MPSVQWFGFRSVLHARDAEKDRFVSLCGISPLDPDSLPITLADDSDVPDGACRKCLTTVALNSTVDEDVDTARLRGYLPTDRVNL